MGRSKSFLQSWVSNYLAVTWRSNPRGIALAIFVIGHLNIYKLPQLGKVPRANQIELLGSAVILSKSRSMQMRQRRKLTPQQRMWRLWLSWIVHT